jgi:hypothetical protein
MLRREVAEAAASGRFQVIPIDTVDQGIELLTGLTSGVAEITGQYREGTLNRRVADRLAAFAKHAEPTTPAMFARRKGSRERSDGGA